VIAVQTGGTEADTSAVTISAPSLTELILNPSSVSLPVGGTQQFTVSGSWSDGSSTLPQVTWTATGGTISSSGLYTAGTAGGTYRVIAVQQGGTKSDTSQVTIVPPPSALSLVLTPRLDTLRSGQTVQYSVAVSWSDGQSHASTVTFTAGGGAITTGGLYTAGSALGAFHVVATCSCSLSDTATVVVAAPSAPTLTALVLNPSSVSLRAGGTQQFTVAGSWSDGSSAAPAVTWTATGGTITTSGLYTAGSTAGTYRVIAVQTGGSMADTSVVTIPPPTLTQLILNPSSVSLPVGGTQQFTVSGSWSDGSSTPPQVTWTATGGTVSSAGLYTAGTTGGTYRVIALQQGGTKSDTSQVTIVPPPSALSLVLTPQVDTLRSGQTVQYSTAVKWSDGQSHASTVTFTPSGGTMTTGGLYTAGSVLGTFLVVATCSCGPSDTATVVVGPTATAPTLTALVINPPSVALPAAGSQQFAVTASWSDGSSTAPAVTWTATGGTITTSGLYTAGSTPGAYQVIAVQTGGSKADTSAVTISPPTLTQLVLNPSSVSLLIGGTQQFTVAGSWSDGSSTPPQVTWTAAGGTITTGGLYTAGSTAGTFRVIAAQQGGTLADTSTVTIAAPPPALGATLSVPAGTTVAGGTGVTTRLVASVTGSNIAGVMFGIDSGPNTTKATDMPPEITTASGTGLYVMSWSLDPHWTPAGNYRLFARVRTTSGETLTSQPVPIVVTQSPTLTQLVVSPKPASVVTGLTQQFSAAGVWSDGSTTAPAVTWSATGGTITASGLYTAGTTAGTFRVIAAQQGGAKSDTSQVTVVLPQPSATSFVLAPRLDTLRSAQTVQYSTAVRWTDGQTHSYSVTFTARGGTITSSGLYTAGSVLGTFLVVATCSCGLSDTSSVVVGPTPTLSALVLNPSSASLSPGGTQQFSVAGTWSDGGSAVPAATYTATGGSITAAGLYTAGSTAGTYRVIAVQTGGTKADTSVVTITAPSSPQGLLPVTLPAAVATLMGPLTPASVTPAAFARYETDFATYEAIRWAADSSGGGAAGAGCKSGAAFDYTDYYDRAFALYQMWARTGNAVYRAHADAIAKCYRDGYLAANNYHAQPNNFQLEGLAVHYLLTGDTRSRDAIFNTMEAIYPGFAASNLTTETYQYWEPRIQGRLLTGALLANALGSTSRNWGAVADSLATMSAALQHSDGSYAWPVMNYYQSNFMVGMLNYSFAQYYRLRSQNAAVLNAIKKSLGYLWSTQWTGTGFKYSNEPGSYVAPDLTGLLVFGWGFVAQVTGDLSYQTTGDQIFAAGIAGAYLTSQKQFNQQYRETSLYLGLRR
jgi:ABC-type uncharacterized transport system auxiliary subunit